MAPSRRTQIARMRAHRAKVGFGVTAAVVFGAAMLFARISYAGHAKHRPATLSPPQKFLRVVRASRLQAGVVAPPQAPPEVATAVS